MSVTITRTAWTDDDGSGTTGTVINNAVKTELYGQVDALAATLYTVPGGGTGVATLAAHGVVLGNGASAVAVTGAGTSGQVLTSNGASADPTFQAPASTTPVGATSTSTGTQNDFAPAAITFVAGQTTLLRANNATLLTINGIAAGIAGAELVIVSVGAGQVDLAHQAAGSTAGNRIINDIVETISIAAGSTGFIRLVYDGTALRWKVIQHDQGEFINYGATSTITGWSSFTTGRQIILYKKINRVVYVSYLLEGPSNATTVSFTLPYPVGNPSGGGLLEFGGAAASATDNGTLITTATRIRCDENQSTVNLYTNMGTGAWTAGGTTKSVRGAFWYPAS